MASEIIVVRGAGGWRDRAKGYDVVFGCAPGRTDPLAAVEEHPDSYVDIWQAANVEEVQAGGPIPLGSARKRAGSLPVLALVWLFGLILFGVGLLAGGGGWQTVVKTVGLAMFVFASWTVVGYRGWLKRRGR